jgi:hypothetical protein
MQLLLSSLINYIHYNLPADIVPMGKTPEENLNVLRRVQFLFYEGAQPHWELVKNMISLILN